MRIKWANIYGLIFLVLIVIGLVKLPKILENFSYSFHMPYYFNDPVYGLMFLGLICVTIVVVVRMLSNR